ncbi:23S rRNA (pseudouridine(1915)-N(3))-methyltransferase RlmH [Caproiciproducens sp. NJN-50]|uniref:23S rRNA (pseudouridine(1915)-N(3))-methyltransferase RlmH n=1 Tax=Acutalibacteraceae TaxID=3082771 RepID=UPI000FFE0B94|nr:MULTISPECIES: 23S rRNA (pseudouridine(1915)-N(3))-methyltransferase RlmH [Acutalibacteraceae]QAT49687.1 23S rRNA (pseudouridine(1915)-N(3))-methyltransferase RlmH [Caproiciproducens sp. NJN-50]
MLRCNLICVGKLKEEYWKKAFQEYEKRLQPFCRFSVTELPESCLPDQPSESQISLALNLEADRILASAEGSVLIALCIEGKSVSSEQLASQLRDIALHGTSKISFVIGSSFGLSDRVKQKAFLRLSMSAMTFPHQMARVMLIEQIYRSFQIIHNGKYHK